MKFIAPEVEIKKFDVVDVLTASGSVEVPSEEVTTVSQEGYPMEGTCAYNESDTGTPECI